MSLIGIALICIAAAAAALVVALLPAIASFRKTSESVGALADMLQRELKPTIQELNLVLNELRVVSGDVAEHTNEVKRFMAALGETGDNLVAINRSVGVVSALLSASSTWATGARAAGRYLIERYLKKRGGM